MKIFCLPLFVLFIGLANGQFIFQSQSPFIWSRRFFIPHIDDDTQPFINFDAPVDPSPPEPTPANDINMVTNNIIRLPLSPAFSNSRFPFIDNDDFFDRAFRDQVSQVSDNVEQEENPINKMFKSMSSLIDKTNEVVNSNLNIDKTNDSPNNSPDSSLIFSVHHIFGVAEPDTETENEERKDEKIIKDVNSNKFNSEKEFQTNDDSPTFAFGFAIDVDTSSNGSSIINETKSGDSHGFFSNISDGFHKQREILKKVFNDVKDTVTSWFKKTFSKEKSKQVEKIDDEILKETKATTTSVSSSGPSSSSEPSTSSEPSSSSSESKTIFKLTEEDENTIKPFIVLPFENDDDKDEGLKKLNEIEDKLNEKLKVNNELINEIDYQGIGALKEEKIHEDYHWYDYMLIGVIVMGLMTICFLIVIIIWKRKIQEDLDKAETGSISSIEQLKKGFKQNETV